MILNLKHPHTHASAVSFGLIFLFFLVPSALAQQDDTWRRDRFSISVGGYRPNVDTSISIADPADGSSGATIDLESDLDLNDRETLPTISAKFRFNKRHAIDVGYFSLKRTAATRVPYDFEFGGRDFTVNVPIESKFDTDILQVRYLFSFLNDQKKELALGLGLHVMDVTSSVHVIGAKRQGHDLTAPLPVIGGFFRYHFNKYLSASIGVDWLDVKIQDLNGALLNSEISLQWYPWQNVGFALGYEIYQTKVTARKSDFDGKFRYDFDGPKLSVETRF